MLMILCACSSVCRQNLKFDFSILLDLTIFSYPKYTGILLEALNLWYHNPAVTTPVLKLMAELVLNRSQVKHVRLGGRESNM